LGVTYFGRIEDVWQEEVEERPKFVEIILKWRSSEKEAIGRLELPHVL
jgi:hypothetical protein